MDISLNKILKKIERSAELVPFGFYKRDGEMNVVNYVMDISFDYKNFPKDHRIMMYSKDNSFTDYFIIKKKATVYDYIRISSEYFPKYEDLSKQQSIFLSNKLMELLHVYLFEFEFPKRYPKKKYYPILMKAMFKEYLFYDCEYHYRLFLCDFDYKYCIFGRRY